MFTATPTFMIDERIDAAYIESSFGDGPLSGNFGARFIQTTTTSTSYNLSTPTPTLQASQNTYDNVLPAVNLVYDLAQDQVSRFSVSEVIARPNTAAEANYVELYDSTLGGVGGNANLKAIESTNFDWDYEYYFAKNSYLAVDFFYKDISNYIVNAANPEQWTDYGLTGHPTETLRDLEADKRRLSDLRGRDGLLPADVLVRARHHGQLHDDAHVERERPPAVLTPRTWSTSAPSMRTSGA